MSDASHRTRAVQFLREPIVVMAVSVFLNVTGFTLIDPVIPSIVGQYQPPSQLALFVGLIISIYAACEFLAAPVLGALSDRFGRKPILLVSLTGSAVGYVVFGIGGATWVLLVGRIIDGLSAGNISVIHACVADVTPPRERGRVPLLAAAFTSLGMSAPYWAGAIIAAATLIATMRHHTAAAVSWSNDPTQWRFAVSLSWCSTRAARERSGVLAGIDRS